MYEPDLDELVYREQIYTGQIKRIKRLYPDMPLIKILSLTSQEASSLINSTHKKYMRNSFEWLHNPARENRYLSLRVSRVRRVGVSSSSQETVLSVSATTVEYHD